LKEATWDKKSLRARARTFSRFLRGVLRSPDLCNHHLVLEFFKIDHHKIDTKVGMKEFSKKLTTALTDL